MTTITLNEMRSYVSITCYSAIFAIACFSVVASIIKHRSIKKTLIKGLKNRFVRFEEISQSEFVGIEPDSGATFHMTNKQDSVLCFKLNYPFNVELMHDYIDQILQRAGYLVTRLPRHDANESLATYIRGDQEHVYTISVYEGECVEHSYIIRIDGT